MEKVEESDVSNCTLRLESLAVSLLRDVQGALNGRVSILSHEGKAPLFLLASPLSALRPTSPTRYEYSTNSKGLDPINEYLKGSEKLNSPPQ